ncbi:MAG: hypothetical protein PHO44_00280 [Sphaerochaetaceae bacterium]|nr:hypothetical protein [Sphaerochaetaceae bacterium]MDD3162993.1 hypothetical protein [Sphaerochaetaceae bacterium]MDD4006393.1 hypothetical protein [Sphaerochaetaceae bacterium]MDD4396242.1 hypothetical protein [Sphaerochaetaceae bacterium]
MADKKKISDFKLFQHFTESLAQVQNEDSMIFDWQKPKMAFCFRLALHLQLRMPEFHVDLQPNPESKALPVCDILVHSREEQDYRPMALICKPDYLSNSEQDHLISLASDENTLVLAVAFFPKKDYFLVYRALQDRIEYYHFDRSTLSCEPLKNKDLPDLKGQEAQYSLKLPRVKPQRRSRKPTADAAQSQPLSGDSDNKSKN